MSAVNIHEAKTNFSKLIERVADGESIVIARAGKPVARLVSLEPTTDESPKRIGFMKGMFLIPDDFDRMFEGEITREFEGDE